MARLYAKLPKTEQLLNFIRFYQIKEGFSPTREEMVRALNLANIMAAQRLLQKLRDAGALEFEKNSKREIKLLTPEPVSTATTRLPLLGTVAAGRPIEVVDAIDSSSQMEVPSSMIRSSHPHYVLRVQGNSMIDEHICDGDFVVIRNQATAENGEKVVALIDGEATLKRFYKKSGRIELHPANEALSPIIVEPHQHLRIAGIYVGLVRVEQ